MDVDSLKITEGKKFNLESVESSTEPMSFVNGFTVAPLATNDLFPSRAQSTTCTSKGSVDLTDLGNKVDQLRLGLVSSKNMNSNKDDKTGNENNQNTSDVKREMAEISEKSDLSSTHIKVSADSIRYNQDSPCPFGCSNCGASFDSIRGLKRHLLSGHCIKVFARGALGVWSAKSARVNSRESSCGSESKRYAASMHDKQERCSVCDKMFQNKWLLRRHMKIHSGEKNFACETCGKKFREKSDLKTHKIKHTNVQRYQCEHCGKKFKWNASYRYHKFQSKSCGSKSKEQN